MGIASLNPSYQLLSTAARQRGFELVAELGEFVGPDIADRPEVHALLAPAPDIEALHGFHPGRTALGVGGPGDEQIDDVRAPAIDHGTDRPRIDVIEPAADQRKTLRGEIDHRRWDVELAVEPRLDRMLVGR